MSFFSCWFFNVCLRTFCLFADCLPGKYLPQHIVHSNFQSASCTPDPFVARIYIFEDKSVPATFSDWPESDGVFGRLLWMSYLLIGLWRRSGQRVGDDARSVYSPNLSLVCINCAHANLLTATSPPRPPPPLCATLTTASWFTSHSLAAKNVGEIWVVVKNEEEEDEEVLVNCTENISLLFGRQLWFYCFSCIVLFI